MQVCVPSTPAQMFHLLRRQMLRSFRKPLIVMTPKSLLRHELSVSSLADLSQSSFANIIDEIDAIDAAQTQRVVFCSGKVYFDLLKARRQSGQRDIAIVRIEQLYPFPVEEYQSVLARYANATSLVWCQEEPQNQGAWFQIRHRLQDLAPSRLVFFAGRAAAAAPATGILKLHEAEQRRLVETALNATSVDQTLRNIPTPRLTLTGTALGERDPVPIRKQSS
jgi:2-oxoglutarate dehydrogenase E1 component